MFSGLLQKDLFKGKWILAKSYFKQNYCHACHTRFAVFFPLPSCCVSSLLLVLKLRIENGGRGIHLAKGQPSSLSITMHELLRCTTFPTTFVRDCTSVHKNGFKTCAVFLSFHVNFVHIFPQPACLDSITFPAVCAFVALSTLIKKIRENRSVRNALKRNRRLERRHWQARRIAQVWRKKKGWPSYLLKFQDSVQHLACERRRISGRRFASLVATTGNTSAFAARVVRRLYNTSYCLINCYLERSRAACE